MHFARALERVIGSLLLFLPISNRLWGITSNLWMLLLPYRLLLSLKRILVIYRHCPLLSLWLLLIKRVLLLTGILLLNWLCFSQKRASEGKNWVINIWCLDRSLVEDRIDVCRILTIVAPLILPIDDRLMLIAESCIRWLKLLGLNWLLYLVV